MGDMRRGVLAAGSIGVLLVAGGAAQADSTSLDGAGHSRVVLHGHLQGSTVLYAKPVTQTYDQAVSTTNLQLSLPKGAQKGTLSVHVESPPTNGGFQLRLTDAGGRFMGGAGGFDVVSYPGGKYRSELNWTTDNLRPGAYQLQLSLPVGGAADYTEVLTWGAARTQGAASSQTQQATYAGASAMDGVVSAYSQSALVPPPSSKRFDAGVAFDTLSVQVKDASGLPVAAEVEELPGDESQFVLGGGHLLGFTCGDRPHQFRLRRAAGTKIRVSTIASSNCSTAAVPTAGTITVTFSH